MTTQPIIGPIPQIGYGTWLREGQDCVDCVLAALDAGYRHIDTAQMYDNEEFVGQAIAASALPRADIFVTTKIWPTDFAPGRVRPAVERSLDKLGLDQVDLLLMHWPSIGDEYPITDYAAQFAEAQDAGLARHIGVSNFTRAHLDRAIDALGPGRIATNQCEIHVLFQNRIIADHSRSRGVPMTAYCPMARGRLVDHPVLQDIAAAHGATASQIGLSFLMAEGHVVIPTSSNAKRIAENFAALGVKLSGPEIARIRLADERRRLVDGGIAPVWDEPR